MNTSMTINATAAWLLALYVALADEQGVDRKALTGTVQNDIIKEYFSRGTYVFPPQPSMRLIKDIVVFTFREVPKWNPTNVCSYHLQEAGATPVQELAYALAIANAVLDTVKDSGEIPEEAFPDAVARISFFVNAGVRFVTEMCKMRAFVDLWDEICEKRYGVTDPKLRRFRYGVQVNSLGLTEQQPENNVYRILLEMLAVVLSKKARARAVQLPAWNEALGLPRPWDQQWSLRMQQIVAYETDLLEYADIFDGSRAIEAKVEELKREAREELARIEAMGGAIAAVEASYMKQRLVESNAARLRKIEAGEQTVVGVNKFLETEPSPLVGGSRRHSDRAGRGRARTGRGAEGLARGARQSAVEASLTRCAPQPRKAATSWSPPSPAPRPASRRANGATRCARSSANIARRPASQAPQRQSGGQGIAEVRAEVERVSAKLGRRLKFLVASPGLDGHSNGAEQIAVRARDCGMEVVYEGIRLTPAQIVNAALEESVHVVGLSILSGSHVPLVRDVMERMRAAGLGAIPVVVGGIIPAEDEATLKEAASRRSTRRRISS